MPSNYALIPRLMYHGLTAPKTDAGVWNRYWGAVRRTGLQGDVLWDSGSERELTSSLATLGAHLDRTLPIVDVGCGNGRHTRALAPLFSRARGVDVSFRAVDRARDESRGAAGASYRVLDAAAVGAGRRLRDELGDCNAYLRGMLHGFSEARRLDLLRNVRELLGERGAVFVIENTLRTNPLDHLVEQGATDEVMPAPLRLCIESGLRPPMRFGDEQVGRYFPSTAWELLERGPAALDCVPLRDRREPARSPAYFVVARRRAGT